MAEDTGLSLNPSAVEETGLSLPTNDMSVPLSQEVAARRTGKTKFAQVVDKSDNDIYNTYLQGQEDMLRKEAATRADFENVMRRNDAIKAIVSRKGSISREEVNQVLDPFNPRNTPVDPSTVIERAYADKYISSLNTAVGFMRDNNLLDSARQEGVPVDGILNNAGDLAALNQYIRTRMENVQAKIEKQGYFSSGVDILSTMLQPITEYQTRGLIPSVGKLDGLSGTNRDLQHAQIFRVPLSEGKKQFDAAMDYLEGNNPRRALEWAQSILSQSSWDTLVNNTFTAMVPVDYGAAIKLLGKGASKTVVAGAKELQVRKAARDVTEAMGKDPNYTPATVAQGVGDLGEAAVQTVVAGQNPLEKASTSLLSTWWDDARKFVSNPGTYLSREATTRLNDFVESGTSLFEDIKNTFRPNRTPQAVTDPEQIRARKDQIKQNYKGPQNTLADIEGPVREPASNTYWYKGKIVYYDGEQMADTATAQGLARQLGIGDPIIKGTNPDYVYLSPSAAKNIESIKTTPEGTRFYLDGGVEANFTTRGEPGMIPYNLKTGKFEKPLNFVNAIEQQGLGFHIEVWFPLKETDDLTRDGMIHTLAGAPIKDALSTSSATGGESLKNSVLGWVRNSDETMSKQESEQRHVVTHGQNNLHRWAAELTRDLEDIANGRVRYDDFGNEIPAWKVWAKNYLGGKIKGKQMFSEFERTLNHAREVEEFFKNPGELQAWYQQNFKRDPSYLETKAYFNYVKLIEGDRMMMELSEFRYRARQGTEQLKLTVNDPAGGPKSSQYFDAIPLNTFPNNTDNYILVMGKNVGDEVLHEIGDMSSQTVKKMSEKISKGEAKAYMIYDEKHMPLNGFVDVAKDKLIRFVYTEGNTESKALDFNHVTRRGGAHFEWEAEHWLKQADVRPQYATGINNKISGLKNFYVGDITLMPVKSRAEGMAIAKLFNEAHELIKQGKWEEVKPIAAKLGIRWDEFTSKYNPTRDASGNPVRALLNPNEPIMVVARNKRIADMGSELADRYRIQRKDDPTKYRETFVDKTKSGPENNFKVQYNQERNSSFNMQAITDIGTQGKPVFAYRPAAMIDPLETMNRALNRMINSSFMDDYKLYHVEHWLREAEPWLDAKGGKNEIRANPFGWYNDPKFVANIPIEVKSNLLSNKMKGQQFVGTPNKFDTWIHSLTSNLADSFYMKFGPEENRSLLQKAVTIVPINMLHHVTDPVSFMRSVTFNFKLGLGAIPQFLVQTQTHSLIWALEPRHGTMGTYGSLLHYWSKFTSNPKILEALDDYATKINMFGSKWGKGEWMEARQEFHNSGFEKVSGEYANLNNQLKSRFILNDFEKGLKIGQYPFRLGEESTRVTAWYTAFREWRHNNPTKVIEDTDRSAILAKANLLTVNMTRASSSALNHGAFSLSTQFLTYQIKLAELFWGKRLGETLTERNLARARILTTFSALYGVPNAIGVTGAPFSDNLREHFMDDLGYIPGEKWLSTMLNEGLPAWQMAMITGKLPNFGDRFGSQGFQNIKQGLNGSIPWWQAVGGASVSTFSNLISSGLDPYYQYSMSWLRGDGTDKRFTIKAADLVEPLKEISSYSTAAKWWTAIQTGLWVSKNEQAVTDVTPWQATIFGLSGMSPQEQDDMFIRNKMLQGEKDAKKLALKEFIKDWRRGLESMDNNDPEQAHDYHKNAMARARSVGMNANEITTGMAIASNRKTAIDSSLYQYWTTGDANQQDARREYFRRYQQMKDKQ